MAQKWKNLRDAWMQCDKKMRETKSGSGAKPIHKYQYYDNLNFLKKNNQFPRVSGLNMPEEKSISEDAVPKKRKNKEEINPVDKKMMKFMENLEKEEDNRVMSFFKGIAPSVELFKDEDIVEFQYQVLNIIRNIQYKNNYSAPHHSRTPEAIASPASYGYSTAAGPSSRNQSQASTYSIEEDSLQSIASPANSILNDFDFSSLNQTN